MLSVLSIICSIVSIITAILLIAVILMQDSKSGGGLGGITNSMSEAMFGGEANSVMIKITTWLAVIFLLATLGKAAILGNQRSQKSIMSDYVEVEAAPAAETPAVEAAPAAETPAAE